MQNHYLTLQCDPTWGCPRHMSYIFHAGQFSQGKLKGYDLMHVHHSNFYVKMYHYKAQPLERWDFDVTFKGH